MEWKEIGRLAELITEDFAEAWDYLPEALLAASCAGLLCLLWNDCFQKGNREKAHGNAVCLYAALAAFYGAELAGFVFFGRPAGSRRALQLQLFETIGSTAANAYVVENVLLFLPFGVLWYLCSRRICGRGQLFFCLSAAFFLSVFIETLQYVFARGYTQLDDVLMNTLGAGIGWLMAWIFRSLLHIRFRRKRREGRQG